MLYLGYVLLRYVLIYNLEVSFNFHLTFLQLLNVIKLFTVHWVKTVFTLLSAIFFELPITRTPDNSNFFRFPLKVRVIGSRLYLQSSHYKNYEWKNWFFLFSSFPSPHSFSFSFPFSLLLWFWSFSGLRNLPFDAFFTQMTANFVRLVFKKNRLDQCYSSLGPLMNYFVSLGTDVWVEREKSALV